MAVPSLLLLVILLHGSFIADGARWIDVNHVVSLSLLEDNQKNSKRSLMDSPPREIIQMDEETDLVESDISNTIEGSKVIKYRETFRGVPIYDSFASVEVDREEGTYTGQASGKLLQDIAHDVTSTTPNLDKTEALNIAKFIFGENVIRYQHEKADLIIYPAGDVATLAYEVSFTAFGQNAVWRRLYILDAKTGHLLKELNLLRSFHVHSTGGNQKVGKLDYGSSMPYLDVRKNDGKCVLANDKVEVYHLHNKTYLNSDDTPYTFTCQNGVKDEVNGAYSPLSDAFFFANRLCEMYTELIGIPPTKTYPLKIWVHFGKNAIVAEYTSDMILFGDGRPGIFYPMISADVLGHEITHGFVEEHSQLEYVGQSGAIDESFSDIAGETLKFFTLGKTDFKAGDSISIRFPPRDMCNPASDGRSIAHARDYTDNLDVHYSSGVMNKAACLMVRSSDMNITQIFKIFAHANRFYWHPTTNYSTAACGIMKAAYDLGYNTENIAASFEKVGIEVCALDKYTRTFHSDVTINDLSAEGTETIIYKFKVTKGRFIRIYTMNGHGDVDVTVDPKRKLRGLTPMYSSETKGNLEIIKIYLKKLNKGYITLKPKAGLFFKGVTLKFRVNT